MIETNLNHKLKNKMKRFSRKYKIENVNLNNL